MIREVPKIPAFTVSERRMFNTVPGVLVMCGLLDLAGAHVPACALVELAPGALGREDAPRLLKDATARFRWVIEVAYGDPDEDLKIVFRDGGTDVDSC